MKKSLFAVAILLLMVSVGYCQEDQSFQLSIKSDKEKYISGEEINIEATIKNISNKEVKIYSLAYPGVSEIVVKDSKGFKLEPYGTKIERTHFEPFLIIPSAESKTYTFKNLLWFHCGGAWQFIIGENRAPATYTIYVTVTNPPVDKCNSGKKFEETDLSGTLTSNTITIEVAEEKLPSCAEKVKSIKVGMTRGDVEKFFEKDGGISGIYKQERYVLRDCLCQSNKAIKADVSFKPFKESGGYSPNSNDVITSISDPYCEHRFFD